MMASGDSTGVKPSRRHESLVPLSREHHHGLMLCLRIHRGVEINARNEPWLRTKAEQSAQFFEGDLVAHFKAEEEILFPAMGNLDGAQQLVDELVIEHRRLEALAGELRRGGGKGLANTLCAFADLLEAHIRKEERLLFPLYETHVDAELATQVEQEILRRIGSGTHPRNPELLIPQA